MVDKYKTIRRVFLMNIDGGYILEEFNHINMHGINVKIDICDDTDINKLNEYLISYKSNQRIVAIDTLVPTLYGKIVKLFNRFLNTIIERF